MSNTILIGFNGDIDSQILSILLSKQGYSIKGVYYYVKPLFLSSLPESIQAKFSKDLDLLKIKAKELSIDVDIIDVSDRFFSDVVDEAIASRLDFCFVNYKQLISNFIINCSLDIDDSFALGYYIKFLSLNDNPSILMHSDIKIDQSDYICNIEKERISKMIFPLGELSQSEKNKIIASYKLSNVKSTLSEKSKLFKLVANSLAKTLDFNGEDLSNLDIEISDYSQKISYSFKIKENKASKVDSLIFELKNTTVKYSSKPLAVCVMCRKSQKLQDALLFFNTNNQLRLEFNESITLLRGQLISIYESAHKNAKLIGSGELFNLPTDNV